MDDSGQHKGVRVETARLLLREARATDLLDFHELFSNAEVMKFWSTPPYDHQSQTEKYLNNMVRSTHNGQVDFVIQLKKPDADGKVIGKVGCWDGSELGFMLNREYWGKGYAKEALGAALQKILTEHTGLCIKADVDPRNHASLGLLKKFGFKETGRAENTFETHLGWCDSVYLTLECFSGCEDKNQDD